MEEPADVYKRQILDAQVVLDSWLAGGGEADKLTNPLSAELNGVLLNAREHYLPREHRTPSGGIAPHLEVCGTRTLPLTTTKFALLLVDIRIRRAPVLGRSPLGQLFISGQCGRWEDPLLHQGDTATIEIPPIEV